MARPGFQIILANFITIFMAIYIIVIRPYDSILSSILSIINEFLLVVMIVGTTRFIDPVITPNESNMIGRAFIWIIIVTIAINWVGIMIYGISIATFKHFR
jgi:hypothetical protein